MATRRELTAEEKGEAAALNAAWLFYKSENKGANQTWLAAEAGLGTQGAVGQYLRAVIPLNLEALLAICKVIEADPLKISPRLTANLAEQVSFDRNVKAAPRGARAIPVISPIQAGMLKEITDPYLPGAGFDVLYTDDDLSRWAFALEIEGDSMLPEFRPGDRVIIDPEVQPQPGDFVAAKNCAEEATFKKYRPRGIDAQGNDIFELTPLNDDYPTLRSDVQELHIIGVMVEHRKKYRRK